MRLQHLVTVAGLWYLAAGQIIRDPGCNPMEKDDCDPNPALASTIDIDFTSRTDIAPFEVFEGDSIPVESGEGAVFAIETESQTSKVIVLPQYIFFGRVEVILRSARGKGIITSLLLQSDTQDEIYFEWIGSDTRQVQTNYVRNGNAEGFDRGANHTVATPGDEFHNYTIDWNKERIEWSVDGSQVRRLTYDAADQGEQFPQTPATLLIGTWVAGLRGNPPGTIEWAGGLTDFDDGPFVATVQRVRVIDYANGVDNATEYTYSNRSTMWEFIDIKEGEEKPDLIDEEDGSSSEDGSSPSSSSSSSSTTDSSSSSGGLGGGAIAGIVVGAVAGCAIIGAACFLLGRRKKRREPQQGNAVNDALLMGGGKGELDGQPCEKPIGAAGQTHGMTAPPSQPQELDGGPGTMRRPLSELGGREIAAELHGHDVRRT